MVNTLKESFLTEIKERAREYRRRRTKNTDANVIVSKSGLGEGSKPKKAKLQTEQCNTVLDVRIYLCNVVSKLVFCF